MKKLTAICLAMVLLCLLPHASAAVVNGDVRLALETLVERCGEIKEEYLFYQESDRAVFEEAEEQLAAALLDEALTDQAAMTVLQTVKEQLSGISVYSVYGLDMPIGYLLDEKTALFRYKYETAYAGIVARPEDFDSYEEVFYHYQNGAMDWVLVHITDSAPVPWEGCAILGNRLLYAQSGDRPFAFGYGVYDVQAERFTPLTTAYFSGSFAELTQTVELLKIGACRGDMNGDGVLTITDVTELQRCLAEMRGYPSNDRVECADFFHGEYVTYLSDLNRNGIHDAGDATQLQRILAEIEIE